MYWHPLLNVLGLGVAPVSTTRRLTGPAGASPRLSSSPLAPLCLLLHLAMHPAGLPIHRGTYGRDRETLRPDLACRIYLRPICRRIEQIGQFRWI